MSSLTPRCTVTLALAAVLFLACQQSSPPPISELPPYEPDYGDGFSAKRAWRDLEALVAIGPRVSGTEGAARAREYIRSQLTEAGLPVDSEDVEIDRGEGAPPLVITNLWTTIPGESEDLFVLVAPYDTRPFDDFPFLGANDGGSGAALLLELARDLHQTPLDYTTRIVFLDGEAIRPDPRAEGDQLQLLGSAHLAGELAQQDLVRHVRLLVFLNQVADADLRVARDLYSHRLYREEFWSAAARLGYTDAFPPDRSFESVPGSHHPFRAVGLHRVVALVDTSYGGDEPPGVYANGPDDNLEHLSAESLAIMGEVVLDALDNVSDRLAKIDRFAKQPLAEPEYATPPPPMADAPVTPESAPEGPAEPAPEKAAEPAPEKAAEPEATPETTPGDAP